VLILDATLASIGPTRQILFCQLFDIPASDDGGGSCSFTQRASVTVPCSRHKGSSKDWAYKTPKLMAIPTPIFSASRICSFHRTRQGSKARDISISADHTSGPSQLPLLVWVRVPLYVPAWNRAYCTDGSLSIHVPGIMSTKAFATGRQSTQGRTAAGIAKIARVAIAKYT
jgi:hypothetical protein